MDPREWRTVMGHFTTGVTVVTTVDRDERRLGMTANAFTSLSLEPPLLLICVDKKSDTLQGLIDSKKFCVNILSDSQEHVSRVFARKGGTDKFKDVHYFAGQTGIPVLSGCLANVECLVDEVLEGGDHWILIGKGVKIYQSEGLSEKAPLVFYQGNYVSINSLASA